MKSIAKRIIIMAQVAIVGVGVLCQSSCASISPEEVQEEPGYYYGTGSDASPDKAAIAAEKDLITKALTQSRERAGIMARIDVSQRMVESFKLPNLKIFAKGTVGGITSVMYRIKEADWDTYQAGRMAAARADVIPRVATLSADSGRTLAERVLEAVALLDRLSSEALADALTENGPGTPLVAATIERLLVDQLAGLSVGMDVQRGFVGGTTVFSGRFVDPSGKATGSLPVRAAWTVRGSDTLVVVKRSAADGTFVLEFPKDAAFHDRSVNLTVSVGLSDGAPASDALRLAEEKASADYCYQFFDDVAKYFSAEALVSGGTFMVGSVDQDKRASKKEAPHKATVADFYMDTQLVTNSLYAMFLGDTKSTSFPEYWDNSDYNQDDQPVIGVGYDDAVAFAAWLSVQLGVVKRLPSEAEWERAARGGKATIYPWGDQSPDEGSFANFNGNGKFAATSPVGSFMDGKNAFGIFDMAGNVWQWTTTPRDPAKGAGNMIVKGGSWMDGPADLRISNRRDLNPKSGYVDVGIRLVREVSK